jgi:GTP-binding protein
MTHWEYPEAVERFGRQLNALGIAAELERRGAVDGDLVMVDKYDFEFAPGMTNPYIPADLLEKDMLYDSEDNVGGMLIDEPQDQGWKPFRSGGYLDEDAEELMGFNEDEGWDLLDQTEEDFDEYTMFEEGDEIWQS